MKFITLQKILWDIAHRPNSPISSIVCSYSHAMQVINMQASTGKFYEVDPTNQIVSLLTTNLSGHIRCDDFRVQPGHFQFASEYGVYEILVHIGR